MKQGLGTQLRHLIELLDGSVGRIYDQAGLQYRPRYTPVMRALRQSRPLTVGQIAEIAGITQPAVTQTVGLMVKDGLVHSRPGLIDGRQSLIDLTSKGARLLPKLETFWEATTLAASELEADLPFPLAQTIESAIRALTEKPFEARIGEAREKLLEASKSRSQR